MGTIKYVFWDFNGTILNDVDISIETMNELLARRKMPLLDKASYRDVFTFPVSEYYERIGILTKEQDFDALANEWMDEYYLREAKSTIFDGVKDVMDVLQSKNITQGVLSASKQEQVERQLKDVGVIGYMHDILGVNDIYATSKLERGVEFMKQADLNPANVVMFGDSVHDYEVASEMGINCVLVANGHMSKKVLETCECIVVDDIRDVLKLAYFA